jgi:hypothetical protein
MSSKKEVVAVYFIISIIVFVLFVYLGIAVKNKILEKTAVEKKTGEEPNHQTIPAAEDVSAKLPSAIFKLIGVLGFVLISIWVFFKLFRHSLNKRP